MAISLYLQVFEDRAAHLLRGWDDPYFNDDWHEDPFFSSPLATKGPRVTLSVDFPALTLADFGALLVPSDPGSPPLYCISGCSIADGRYADIAEDGTHYAADNVYVVRLPIAFLRANASTPVRII